MKYALRWPDVAHKWFDADLDSNAVETLACIMSECVKLDFTRNN